MENRPDRVRSLHIPFPFLSFPSFVVVVVVVAKHTARSLKVVVPQTKAQNPHRFSLRLSGRRLLGRFVARVKFSRALLSLLGKKKSTRRRREVVVVVKERSLSLGSSQTQRYNKTHTTTVIMVVTKMPDGSSFSRPLEFRVFLKNLKP